MRHWSVFAGVLLLLGLVLWSALASFSTYAQEDTPAPPLTPPSPTAAPSFVGLPFADTFDTATYWVATGAWVYDDETAYDGYGWMVDGARRATESTLTYLKPIDLFGALNAQLMFRQRGNLPSSDLIAVDLSLDGGDTWFLIDQQLGILTGWEQHRIDLTTYRGQLIRLRIRVHTGAQLPTEDNAAPLEAVVQGGEGEDAIPLDQGYWIDNLAIQYIAEAPEPDLIFVPEDSGPRTLMGLHLVVGAQKSPVVDLARRLRALGWPLGTLKGTTGTEDILTAVATLSPETVIVYRSLETPWGMRDCPNSDTDPVAEAQRWVLGLQPYWARVPADYYELMNECQPPAEWLVPFTIESMRMANLLGECLLVFSFAPGKPELDYFAQLTPVLEYALENPCRSGRYHGIALHAYGVNTATLVSESGLYLGFRHRLLIGEIIDDLPEALRLPVYLTEAGPGDGSTPFECQDIVRDVLQYTQQLEYDPYVRGFHLWNIGDASHFVDISECLPALSDALAGYYAGR